MNGQNTTEFKNACEKYLNSIGLAALRAYGRSINLKEPTKKNKPDLIAEIVAVLCGELIPQRTKRGAPVKNDYVDPQLLTDIKELQRRYLPNTPSEQEEIVELISGLSPDQKRCLLKFLKTL